MSGVGVVGHSPRQSRLPLPASQCHSKPSPAAPLMTWSPPAATEPCPFTMIRQRKC